MTTIPTLDALLPHEAPMILVDELVDVGDLHVHCRVTIRNDGLFFDPETRSVPGWVGIELMAQSVVAWSGYHAWQKQQSPSVGFLLGSRRYRSQCSRFDLHSTLDIHADQIMENNGMAVFSCRIEIDGEILASSQLNAYVPPAEKLEQMKSRKPL